MVVQGGHPPPGPDGPWIPRQGVDLSPDAPPLGTWQYISLAYIPQGPNTDQCPGGYEMAASSKENPSQTCIMSKAVGYTTAIPLIVNPVLSGSAAPEKTQFQIAISQLLEYLTPTTIAALLAAIAAILLLFTPIQSGEATSSVAATNTRTTSQQGGRKQRQSKGKHKGRTNRRS